MWGNVSNEINPFLINVIIWADLVFFFETSRTKNQKDTRKKQFSPLISPQTFVVCILHTPNDQTMAASFARTSCPRGQNKIMGMVEAGMDTDEIAQALQETAERKTLALTEGNDDDEEMFPGEIRLIAQALAFRNEVDDSDLPRIWDVLSAAYQAEVSGLDAYRSGIALSKDTLNSLHNDASYKWLIVEAPNGHHVEIDGAILGVCCYSTDGISRRNGEVEGNLGSIRLFGVLPRYHGLCIGQRLLKRVEGLMFREQCCRSMICIPSPRALSMGKWVERRGYVLAGSTPYPALAIGHVLTKDPSDVSLMRYIKPLESVDGITDMAESKDKVPQSQP